MGRAKNLNMLMDMFNHLHCLLNKSGFLSNGAWPHSLFFLVWEKLFWGKMGWVVCWKHHHPLVYREIRWHGMMTGCHSFLRFYRDISTLSTLALVPLLFVGSYSYISTKLKMISCWHTTLIARRGKPVMRLVWQQVSRQMWLQSRLSIRNTTTMSPKLYQRTRSRWYFS